jgi:rSAM/selenodomain-associated transferase 2
MSIDLKTSVISIVIPALDEEKYIGATLACLAGIPGVEIIVADGGSRDATLRIAASFGVRIVSSSPGRARQMNAGAEAASGDIFLFLHADTGLPPGFATHVRHAMSDGSCIGAFQLAIDAPGAAFRIIEKAATWRARLLGLPYGDQALFLPARLFERAGGFPEIPILEEVVLLKALQGKAPVRIVSASATTSGRRWQRRGIVKTTLLNQMTALGYFLGVSPYRLAVWYRCRREQ